MVKIEASAAFLMERMQLIQGFTVGITRQKTARHQRVEIMRQPITLRIARAGAGADTNTINSLTRHEPARRTRAWVKQAIAAASAVVLSTSVWAACTGTTFVAGYDFNLGAKTGTAPADAGGTCVAGSTSVVPGDDYCAANTTNSASGDFIIRTKDVGVATLKLTVAGGVRHDNLTLRVTIPDVAGWASTAAAPRAAGDYATWAGIPSACTGAGSALADGGRTLVCNLGVNNATVNREGLGDLEIAVPASLQVSGLARNGETFPLLYQISSLGANALGGGAACAAVAPVQGQQLYVSARPKIDIKTNFRNYIPTTVGGVQGYFLDYNIFVDSLNNATVGGEVVSSPLNFNVGLGNLAATTGLPAITIPAADRPQFSGVFSAGNGTPTTNLTSSTPVGTSVGNSTTIPVSLTPRPGVPACVSEFLIPGGGCRETPVTTPERLSTNFIRYFVPLTAFDALPGGINQIAFNNFINSDGSTANQPITTPPASAPASTAFSDPNNNNIVRYDAARTLPGSFSKLTTQLVETNTAPPASLAGVPGAAANTRLILNNEGGVNDWCRGGTCKNYVGRPVESYLRLFNRGATPWTNAIVCDKFDNRGQILTPKTKTAAAGSPEYPNNQAGAATIAAFRLGTRWTSPIPDGWTVEVAYSSNITPASSATGQTSTLGLRGMPVNATNCGDGDTTSGWINAASVTDFTPYNMVRARFPTVLTVFDPVVQNNEAQLHPVFFFTVPADAPDGEYIGNHIKVSVPQERFGGIAGGWNNNNYDPITNAGAFDNGQRFQIVKGTLRVAKQGYTAAGLPTNTPAATLSGGNTVLYVLSPSYTAPPGIPAPNANIVVTDILPAPLTYVPNSARLGSPTSVAFEPTSITVNGAGNQVLTWLIPSIAVNSAVPQILLEARAPTTFPAGQVVINTVIVTDNNVDRSPEAERSATKSLTGDTPAGLFVDKSVSAPLIPRNGTFSYTLAVGNLKATPEANIDVIDVLPRSGGAQTQVQSNFAGTVALSGPLTAPAGATVYYTSAAAGSAPIALMSTVASPNGSLVTADFAITPTPANGWCLPANFGTAGCPASFAAVTAVRIQAPSIAANSSINLIMPMITNGNAEPNFYINRFTARSTGFPNALVSNEVRTEVRQARLGGRVYVDSNLSATFNSGETTLAGVTVTLTGTSTLGNPVTLTTTTNASGEYEFTDLFPGTYRLVESQPASYISAAPNAPGTAGGAAVGANEFNNIPLAVGQSATNYNFGEQAVDVSTRVTITQTTANIGSVVNGVVEFANPSTADATGLTLTFRLPSYLFGVTLSNSVLGSATYDITTGLVTFVSVPTGITAGATITVPFSFAMPGSQVTVTSTISATNDSVPPNNSSTDTITPADVAARNNIAALTCPAPSVLRQFQFRSAAPALSDINAIWTTGPAGNPVSAVTALTGYTTAGGSTGPFWVGTGAAKTSVTFIADATGGAAFGSVPVINASHLSATAFRLDGNSITSQDFSQALRIRFVADISKSVTDMSIALFDIDGNPAMPPAGGRQDQVRFSSNGTTRLVQAGSEAILNGDVVIANTTLNLTVLDNPAAQAQLRASGGSLDRVTLEYGRAPGPGAALSAGTTSVDRMALCLPTYTVSGNVFVDSSGDRIRNGTESATTAGGVTAYLIDKQPGSPTEGKVVGKATVDGSGNYTLTGVTNGNYEVTLNPDATLTPDSVAATGVFTAASNSPTLALGAGFIGIGINSLNANPQNFANHSFTVANADVLGRNFAVATNADMSTVIDIPQASAVPATTLNGTVSFANVGNNPANGVTLTLQLSPGLSNVVVTSPVLGNGVYNSSTGQVTFPSTPASVLASFTPTTTITANVSFTQPNFTVLATSTVGAINDTNATNNTSTDLVLPSALSLAGNVFNDINGLSDNTVNGSGTNAGGLNAVLVDALGNVVAVTPVASNGVYTFTSVQSNTNYTVILSTATPGTGTVAPTPSLPAGWTSTGENNGTAAGSDGVVNTRLPVSVGTTSVTNANLGIEQLPVAGVTTATAVVNPLGTATLPVPVGAFVGSLPTGYNGTPSSDPGGSVTAVRITGMPADADSITINGITYTPTNFPAGGVTVTVAQLAGLVVDPTAGATSVTIPYLAIDAAGKVSSSPGSVNLPLINPVFEISGSVFYDRDRNGSQDNPSTETGIAGVTVTLCRVPDVPCTGSNFVATTTTTITGSYAFLNVAPGTYYVQETQPAGYGSSPSSPNVRPAIVTTAPVTGLNFADTLSSISGLVYQDNDGSQNRNGSEPTMPPGITITLTGVDVTGAAVTRTAVTSASGTYVFEELRQGTYTVTETQPEGFGNGAAEPGSSGGTGGTNSNVISAINLASGTDSPNNNFGDIPRNASVSGTVWRDTDHDNIRDPGETPLSGWTVQLYREPVGGGTPTLVATTTTGSNGEYNFNNQEVGSGYSIRFIAPNGAVYGGAVNGESGQPIAGGSQVVRGELTGLTLQPGQNIPQQSLPVDPSGVVYDSQTRQPVPGAQVTLEVVPGSCTGGGVFDPAIHLVGGAGNQTQIVGADGLYQFLLNPNAPSCQYRLVITPPGTYVLDPAISPQPGPLSGGDRTTNPTPLEVVPNFGAPQPGQPTTWYQTFNLGPNSRDIINNHIPLIAGSPASLLITKSANKSTVELGDTVQYKVRVRYAAGATNLTELRIVDTLPAGFRLIASTSQVSVPAGASSTAVASSSITGAPGPEVTYNILLPAGGLTVGQEVELTYRVRVGVGSMEGDGINRAQALSTGTLRSNIARAKVNVTGGVFTNEGCVVGKIYVDCNNNHMQDAEELGVPGVRLYLNDGTHMVSDSEGKYSICGLQPQSWILKVDQLTLPRGSRLTTSSNRNLGNADSLWVDLKNGELHQADFIIGSCSNTVLEQVKARRNQGGVRSIDTERQGGPALKWEGKAPGYPDQGTDSANQPLVKPRPPGPPRSPGAPSNAENNIPVPLLPDSSGNTRGKNLRDAK